MPELPLNTWLYLFDTCVAPILLYGAEVWGLDADEKINVVENKFLRFVLGLPNGTPASIMNGN